MDEHRLGLKPILGKVWGLTGQRPVARVEHRFEWLYLYAFVCPQSGQNQFWVFPEVNTVAFGCALKAFAQGVGAGKDKHILLVLDGAGWHVAKQLKIPEGISLLILPPHSPELQPAEHLWSLTDIPLVNQHFLTLEHLQNTLEPHLAQLETQTERIRSLTHSLTSIGGPTPLYGFNRNPYHA